jgi:hypothetical protein
VANRLPSKNASVLLLYTTAPIGAIALLDAKHCTQNMDNSHATKIDLKRFDKACQKVLKDKLFLALEPPLEWHDIRNKKTRQSLKTLALLNLAFSLPLPDHATILDGAKLASDVLMLRAAEKRILPIVVPSLALLGTQHRPLKLGIRMCPLKVCYFLLRTPFTRTS